MSTRVLRVRFVNSSCAYISGHGSRELLTELRGRPPVWATIARAWVAQPCTARDLIAVAESRRWSVVIEDDEQMGLAL